MWIRSSQDELKSSKHYKDLAVKLKLAEIDGLLRCKGRLEYSDLEPESQQPIIVPKDEAGDRGVSSKDKTQRNSCNTWRTQIAILGTEREAGGEEGFERVRDMYESAGETL